MKRTGFIKFDPRWYIIPIDPENPGGGEEGPGGGGGSGNPVLPGLGAFLRPRYTSNVGLFDEMSLTDFINEVLLIACRGWVSTGPSGTIRARNKKPADYAYATAALTGTTLAMDDVSPWVSTLKWWIVIDPHTVNSEVRTVISAVYPATQNSTTLTSSHPTEITVTAFTGAAGGATPASAAIDTSLFVEDTTYIITLDGVEISFIPRAADTGGTIAAFIAGAVRGDPRLNRRFTAVDEGDNKTVTLIAKFGTLTLNNALAMTHDAPVANPTAAPTLTATASGQLPAGVYRVAYAYQNNRGRTLLSPFKEVTLAANEKITVSAITPPAGVTVVWYVSVEASSQKIRRHSENDGASFVINWPLPKKTASSPPTLNRTGAEIIRVSGVYSDRAIERSAIGSSNVIKATFKWQLGRRRNRKNVVELTYKQSNADYRIVTLRERDDANIAKVKDKKTEKVNGMAIDTYFQAKRISSGLLAEWLDADFFYSWEATRRALLQEEGDTVVVTDSGSGVINLPIWIEEIETRSQNGGLPAANFVGHRYFTTLYDDSVNELAVPLITEIETQPRFAENINVAMPSEGASITASSTHSSGLYPIASVTDGYRHPNNNWGAGGGWNSNVDPSVTPVLVDIDFGQERTISIVNVITLADASNYNTEPTLEDTFTAYGITDFTVQYWDGSAYVTQDTVASNNKVWRQFVWPDITTSKIRVRITGGAGAYARLTEVEAWGY
jgi:hypothetical protein